MGDRLLVLLLMEADRVAPDSVHVVQFLGCGWRARSLLLDCSQRGDVFLVAAVAVVAIDGLTLHPQ